MVVNCPKCGKKTALLNNVCEHCGVKTRVCKECGNIVDASEKLCDYCGYEFLPEEQEKVLEQQIEQEKKLKNMEKDYKYILNCNQKSASKYFLISLVTLLLGIVLLAIAYFILKDFGDYKNKSYEEVLESLANAKDIKNGAQVCVWLCGLLFLISNVSTAFTQIFLANSISSKIYETKFDYVTYFKSRSTIKNLANNISENSDFSYKVTKGEFNAKEINFLYALMISEDLVAKKRKMMLCLIETLIWIVCLTLLCVGVCSNIENYISTVIWQSTDKFKFDFNTEIIIGAILFVAGMVMEGTMTGSKIVLKWVSNLKENK